MLKASVTVLVTSYLLLLGASAQATGTIDVPKGSAEVAFEAIGNPSALRIHGKTSEVEGSLTSALSAVTGQFTCDLSTLSTGIRMRDYHMTHRYLETDKFPKATLVLSSVGNLKSGSVVVAGTYPFQGQLEIHGVKKPVSGSLQLDAPKDGQAHFMASFKLKISDYGISIPSFAGITVANEVNLTVDGKAKLPPKDEF